MRIGVSVITGGRPELKDRPTAKYLPALFEAFGHVEWVIREDHAADYERDDFPLNVYSLGFDDSYSRTHWRHPRAVWEPGGFHGAFTGREWAMRTATERGLDMVVQMDDNIRNVGLLNSTRPAAKEVLTMAEMVTILCRLAWATNAMTCGMQLNSVRPPKQPRIIRPGYPYSLFVEKTGPGRMPWYGPFEDDVMHSLEYALHGGPHRTAAVVETFVYGKVSGGTGGMRKHYNPYRSLELPRRYPRNAQVRISNKTSSPVETERGVRHILNTRGFTPVRIADRDMYTEARDRIIHAVAEYQTRNQKYQHAKIAKRAQAV